MRFIILILLLVLIFASQLNTIVDIDLWWIFRTGEFILKNMDVPRIDIFSYAAGNRNWVDHEWFSQIILYAVFEKFGWAGINILKAVIISLCFLILLFMVYARYKKIFFAVVFTLFSLLAFGYRSFARPEIFSYLLLILFFYILEKGKRLYILPLLQILWVNLHGYFILGPILIFLYLLGELISGNVGRAKKLGVVLGLAGLACFINPYFYKGAFYPFRILLDIFTEQKIWMQNMSEVAVPVKSNFRTYIFLWVFTILSSATFILNIKKVKIKHILIYAFLFAFSYIALRNMPIFIFLGMPLASINLNEIKLTKNMPEKKFYPLLIITISCLVYFFVSDGYYKFTGQFPMRKTGSEFSRLLTPFGACDFLKKNHIMGRIFNTVDFGPYIAYEFYPAKRIFIDSRSDFYKDTFYKVYSRAENNPAILADVQKKYGFNIGLIRHLFKDQERLLKYLRNSIEWHMVYYDENSVIFLRNMPENMEVIRKYKIDFNEKKLNVSDVDIRIANFFQKIGELKLAEEAYLKLLAANPKYLEAGNNLAVIYINTGRLEDGAKLINRFLNYYPKSQELYANMKTAYLRMEDRRQSHVGDRKILGR